MDQNKKSTFQKLDSLVEETRQIIQDTMILFERVENSAQLVNEMKKNITKWTTSFNKLNKMMVNYTNILQQRANQVQEQLNCNKLVKE